MSISFTRFSNKVIDIVVNQKGTLSFRLTKTKMIEDFDTLPLIKDLKAEVFDFSNKEVEVNLNKAKEVSFDLLKMKEVLGMFSYHQFDFKSFKEKSSELKNEFKEKEVKNLDYLWHANFSYKDDKEFFNSLKNIYFFKVENNKILIFVENLLIKQNLYSIVKQDFLKDLQLDIEKNVFERTKITRLCKEMKNLNVSGKSKTIKI